MRVTWRDQMASVLVAMAVLGYALWLVAVDNPTERGIRAMAATVLGLGFVASATAVVPGFWELIHGSRIYLAAASSLGLVALTTGVMAFVSADTTMLAVLVVATVVMWAMASVRHATEPPARTPAAQRPGEGGVPTAARR
jgi:uncharacterized membrane protein